MTRTTIIIPVFNGVEVTRQCVETILGAPPGCAHEIVVVDDGSSDGTAAYLEGLGSRVGVIRNEENLGFARACNRAASAAAGDLLLFLNNDTIPHPGWLDEMVLALQADDRCGVVGSRLLFPDGRIQHAGIAFDHELCPYHPHLMSAATAPEVNRRREVPAVTGACLLVRRALFLECGGFDEAYVNGYEDVDLCLRARERGFRTVYCPTSVVTHLEGASGGRDATEAQNKERFLRTWKEQVAETPVEIAEGIRCIGFHQRQGEEPLWMGARGGLIVEAGRLEEPGTLRFEVACSKAEHYETFPFELRITKPGAEGQVVRFEHGGQVVPVSLRLDRGEFDVTVSLESGATFVPALTWDSLDQRAISIVLQGVSVGPREQVADEAAAGPEIRESVAVCTVVSKNYVPFARTLSRSIRAQHPDMRIFVLLVDRLDGEFDPAQEPFELLEIGQLDNIPQPEGFCFKYTPIELNTAAKPFFFEYLFRRHGLTKLLFFDPDILLLHQLDHLLRLLDDHSMVLTPHITEPYADDKHPSEIEINRAGVFNLGFIGMRWSDPTQAFLSWWKDRLYRFCYMDLANGMHVDQNWVTFAPAMFDGVYILRDPAYNIAYWNLHSRHAAMNVDGDRVEIHGKPAVFFHFSGFDPDDVERVSRHQDRFTLSDLPELASLFAAYRERLLANGYREARGWKYAFGCFDNGVRIPEVSRRWYAGVAAKSDSFGDPFATAQPTAFIRWLNGAYDESAWKSGSMVTRLMVLIYKSRPDLKAAFPEPKVRDREAFAEWFRTTGHVAYRLDPSFVPPAVAASGRTAAPARGGSSSPGKPRRKIVAPFGANVCGYFQGEFGVAEAARDSVKALRAVDVRCALNNLVSAGHRYGDASFTEFTDRNPYAVNLVHVNADETPAFWAAKGREYGRGRYNIGVWFWELERFPARWASHFEHCDEIWVKSEFCRQSIAKVSPVPVTNVGNAVVLSGEDCVPDRAAFGLEPDEYVFLFVFDFLSVVERKNPGATMEAFRRAFGGDEKVTLLIKSINAHHVPEKAAALKKSLAGQRVRFIDEHLDRATMLSLMASADSFVSLHRSEGFGLGMAQAMYLGKPVIATGYSGNMEFMTRENSFVVDHHMVELERDYGPYERGNIWAEPSVEHAASLMRLVVDNRLLAAERGARAAQDIRSALSLEVIGRRMEGRMRQVAGATQRATVRR